MPDSTQESLPGVTYDVSLLLSDEENKLVDEKAAAMDIPVSELLTGLVLNSLYDDLESKALFSKSNRPSKAH